MIRFTYLSAKEAFVQTRLRHTQTTSASKPNIVSSNEHFEISNVTFKQDYSDKGLQIRFENGRIIVAEDNAADGNYTYTITPYITVKGVETALKAVTFTVKVTHKLPKVTLSSSTVKLNKNYNETVKVAIKLTDPPVGAAVNWFITEANDVIEDPVIDGKTLAFKLKDTKPAKGTYTVTLTPKFSNAQEGTPIKVKISVIDSAAKTTVSVKGNLNQFDLLGEENCLGTIKFSNIQANVESIKISSDLVDASLNEDGKIVFTLKKDNLKDQTIKNIPLTITMDTGDKIETTVTVKVARKAPKLKLEKTTLNVYDTSYQNVEVGRIALKGHDFGEIADVWFAKSLAYRLEYDKETDEIVVYLIDAANVKVGSSSKVTIKIDYLGDYGTYEQSLTDKTIKGLKTTTLSLTIKDASNIVKNK